MQFGGDNLSKMITLSEKGSTLKEKNLLPSFLL